MEIKGEEVILTKKEWMMLIKIFRDTNFDNEFQTKDLLNDAKIVQDPIFQNIKNLLLSEEALIVERQIGSVFLMKIDYRKLASVIKKTDIFKMFSSININRL